MTHIIPQPEREARRIAAAAVLADYKRELASAPLSRPPGREWMFRLADVLGQLLAALEPGTGQRENAGDLDDGEDALEPYCRACGRAVGRFIGYKGWHHFRGDGSAASPVELQDAGHAPLLSWRRGGVR